MEQHYYNARHTGLLGLGLQPRLLNEELIDTMLARIKDHERGIDPATLVQNVRWAPRTLEPSHA
jgi:UDP-sulfoquinovose synthase